MTAVRLTNVLKWKIVAIGVQVMAGLVLTLCYGIALPEVSFAKVRGSVDRIGASELWEQRMQDDTMIALTECGFHMESMWSRPRFTDISLR